MDGRQRPITVTVVDNASSDGTVEMVQSDFSEAALIASPDNLGFSRREQRGDPSH